MSGINVGISIGLIFQLLNIAAIIGIIIAIIYIVRFLIVKLPKNLKEKNEILSNIQKALDDINKKIE